MRIARDIIRESGFDKPTRDMMNAVFDLVWENGHPEDVHVAVIIAESIVSAVEVGYDSPQRIEEYAFDKMTLTLSSAHVGKRRSRHRPLVPSPVG